MLPASWFGSAFGPALSVAALVLLAGTSAGVHAQQAADASAAAAAAEARARCAVLLALGEDLPSEGARRNLFEYCAYDRLRAGADLPGLAADLARLEWRGHWRIATVREALGLRRLHALLASRGTASDGWAQADADTLFDLLSRACVQKLLAQLAGAPTGPSGLERSELARACPTVRGVSGLPAKLDALLRDRVLWTVFTQAPFERVSVDIAGRASLHFEIPALSEQARAPKLAGEEPPRGFGLALGAHGVHVALVPEGSLVTTTASARADDPGSGFAPLHRVEVASSDFGFALALPPPDALACLDIRADLSAHEQYAVLVDGHRLTTEARPGAVDGTVTAFSRHCLEPDRAHRLHVVRLDAVAAKGASPPVLVDQLLEARQLKAGGEAIPIHFDLARSKQVTMLLTLGALCEKAGVDPEIVRLQLAAFMKERFGERFVDPQQLSALVGAAKGLAGDGRALSGESSRGGLDFMKLLQTLSARQLHRGFEAIVDARLACSKRADDRAWDFSFAATAHRPDGPSLGPFSLTTGDPAELADVIREPIARMARALDPEQRADGASGTYARLVNLPERVVSYRETRLSAAASPEAADGRQRVHVEAVKLAPDSGRVVCSGLAAYRQLRSATFTASDWRDAATGQFAPADRADGEDHAFVLPNEGPGAYLLRVRAGDDASIDSGYRCISVYEPDSVFWGAALGGYELASFSPELRDETGLRSSFLLGYREPNRTFRFGFGLGYSLAWRELDELPAWDGLDALPSATAKRFDAKGQLELSWRRHALLLFPSVELRLLSWRRFRPFARAMLMLDAGVIAGAAPAGLAHFASDSGVDFDVDLLLLAGTEIQLTARYALTLLGGLGCYALDDAVIVAPSRRSYDALFELSLGVGLVL